MNEKDLEIKESMKWVKSANWPFVLSSGIIALILGFIWIDCISSQIQHPLYSGFSLLLIFLSSVVILALSMQPFIVPKLISLMLSFFYTQRVVVTYFVPDDFTYNDYRHFSIGDIESVALFYFFSTLVIFFGYAVLGRFLYSIFKSKISTFGYEDATKIRYFLFSVSFSRLAKLGIYIYIFGSIFQCYEILNGFGSKGGFYEADETLLMWFTELGATFAPFVIFSFIYFPMGSKEYSLAKIGIFAMIFVTIMRSTKGTIIGTLLYYYLIASVLNKHPGKNFYIVAIFSLIFSVFIFFPAMTVFRNAINTGNIYFDLDFYFDLLPNAFLSFSNRLGAFDWMTLWSVIPLDDIPPNASVLGEIVSHLNSLVVGDLIEQPDNINMSKLMVVLGRGYGDLFELGGHAENLGGLGTVLVYFGRLVGLLYLTIWSAGLYVIERLYIHPFHKVVLLNMYVVIFLIGGGFVLAHSSFTLFIILTTLAAGLLRSYSRRG